jgi:UV radiation resistance-associated gene protein
MSGGCNQVKSMVKWKIVGDVCLKLSALLKATKVMQRKRMKELALEERREELEYARSMFKEDQATILDADKQLAAERSILLFHLIDIHLTESHSAHSTTLHQQINPCRTTLISTLASIFPIELRSGSDLLFTILDIPLPIPQGTADPAPPLSLAAHKDVSDDAVASALGYAALTVQLLAEYMDRPLVYPITFFGSKSVIRDDISAMVGPRL